MNILILLIIISLSCFARGFYLYGYQAREKVFQDNPVTYVVGGENALWVGRAEGKMKVRIYKKNLIDFLK